MKTKEETKAVLNMEVSEDVTINNMGKICLTLHVPRK